MSHRNTRYTFFAALLVTFFAASCDRALQVGPFVPPTDPRAFTHLDLGNPTNATTNPDNFLMVKTTFALSYNNSLQHANWVSWETNATYLGTTDRTNDFAPDMALPMDFVRVQPNAFFTTGFDRGHILPSADRTFNTAENRETFLMTNMIPQAPGLNRSSWNNLEQYCREYVQSGYRLYIIAGAYGTGGDGSAGAAERLGGVNVPKRNYKVIVATKAKTVENITRDAVVIATDFPNSELITQNRDWVRFITTAAEIEKNANINLFERLPASLQTDFKQRLFSADDAPIAVQTSCKRFNGRALYIGQDGGCFYLTAGGNKVYIDRKLCDCE